MAFLLYLHLYSVDMPRLDKKKTPYDLIWEDSELLAGKVLLHFHY
jgi:hypothetical protein